MLAFIVRRLIQSVVVMFFVAMLAFAMFRFVGDPVHQMVGIETSLEEREALRVKLGLRDPIYVQFARFVGNAATGEFGISYQHQRLVSDMIRERMPATLELSIISALFSLFVGVPMGVYTGLHRHGWLSKVFMTASLIGISLPTFLIGILLIFVFAVLLGWLPSFGRDRLQVSAPAGKGLKPKGFLRAPWSSVKLRVELRVRIIDLIAALLPAATLVPSCRH